MAEEHKRRVRYKGTHPKTFEEKYKERDPKKYADTVAHVIAKGSTPAGMHISIMVSEILEVLAIQPGMKGIDCTLGYGGHTRKMMEQLFATSKDASESNEGHMYALDIDPIERVKTKERLMEAGFGEERLTILPENFGNLAEIAKEYGPFDFLLADLGVSSMQIDDPKRGFSYKLDGPLDLRLNPEAGQSAAERLKQMDRMEIAGMLSENSDEPYAEEIAKEIIQTYRRGEPIETTTDLRQCIERALKFLPENAEKKDILKKTCQRVFQAIRIDVNSEFEVLEAFLEALPEAMNEGGRIAILTFHSGEDRLVKKAFARGLKEGVYSEIAKDVIRPSAEECRQNGRARSTKLRYAIR